MAPKKLTSQEFIDRARVVHGDNYDYSKVVYRHSHINVKIICQIHGAFQQKPSNHLYGKGCPDCAAKDAQVVQKAVSTEPSLVSSMFSAQTVVNI